jgi:hypothetical protein
MTNASVPVGIKEIHNKVHSLEGGKDSHSNKDKYNKALTELDEEFDRLSPPQQVVYLQWADIQNGVTPDPTAK